MFVIYEKSTFLPLDYILRLLPLLESVVASVRHPSIHGSTAAFADSRIRQREWRMTDRQIENQAGSCRFVPAAKLHRARDVRSPIRRPITLAGVAARQWRRRVNLEATVAASPSRRMPSRAVMFRAGASFVAQMRDRAAGEQPSWRRSCISSGGLPRRQARQG